MTDALHLPYWIQSADYSSNNIDPVSVEDALNVLRNHDWATELAAQSALRAEKKKAATPGIGFHHGPDTDLHLLHLCPQEDGTWISHYIYPETVRRFWFWTAIVNKRTSKSKLATDTIETALTAFFEDRHFDVLDTLEGKA